MDGLQEIQSMLSERVESWTAEWVQHGWRQGWKEGWKEGWQEGRQLGEFALLQRQLARRFGALPEQHLQRLRDASSEQLEAWGERLLDVASLDALFRQSTGGAG